MTNKRTVTIVHEQNFAHATRETGYRTTGAAVSELVDNAVQARAKRVRVLVTQSGIGKEREITVAVADDGCGMSANVLQQALQFGGSTRFDDRNGMGRFGMGLPNSSLSQARRVEVYSWRSRSKVLATYLDLDEIASGDLKSIPKPKRTALPEWLEGPSSRSGTLVVWKKCDRLDYKKAITIEEKLIRELGRLFRHLIWGGLSISVNGNMVVPIDPLLLHPDAEVSGADLHLEPLEYEFKPHDQRGPTGLVVVRFTRLPVAAWHSLTAEEKRCAGIVGGAGVNIVRAGREIAHGWYFMGDKRRQNYDDWWRCELRFDPVLDEWFGVTHSKQGIRPKQELTEVLTGDLKKVAHELSAEVRASFAALGHKGKGLSATVATKRDWRLPLVQVAGADQTGKVMMSHLSYRIEDADTTSRSFFEWRLLGNELILILNRNHPFFTKVYMPARRNGAGRTQQDLECMLLAFARAAEATSEPTGDELRSAWSDVLAVYVGE